MLPSREQPRRRPKPKGPATGSRQVPAGKRTGAGPAVTNKYQRRLNPAASASRTGSDGGAVERGTMSGACGRVGAGNSRSVPPAARRRHRDRPQGGRVGAGNSRSVPPRRAALWTSGGRPQGLGGGGQPGPGPRAGGGRVPTGGLAVIRPYNYRLELRAFLAAGSRHGARVLAGRRRGRGAGERPCRPRQARNPRRRTPVGVIRCMADWGEGVVAAVPRWAGPHCAKSRAPPTLETIGGPGGGRARPCPLNGWGQLEP